MYAWKSILNSVTNIYLRVQHFHLLKNQLIDMQLIHHEQCQFIRGLWNKTRLNYWPGQFDRINYSFLCWRLFQNVDHFVYTIEQLPHKRIPEARKPIWSLTFKWLFIEVFIKMVDIAASKQPHQIRDFKYFFFD